MVDGHRRPGHDIRASSGQGDVPDRRRRGGVDAPVAGHHHFELRSIGRGELPARNDVVARLNQRVLVCVKGERRIDDAVRGAVNGRAGVGQCRQCRSQPDGPPLAVRRLRHRDEVHGVGAADAIGVGDELPERAGCCHVGRGRDDIEAEAEVDARHRLIGKHDAGHVARAGQVGGIIVAHRPAAEAGAVAAVTPHGSVQLQAERTGSAPGLFRADGGGGSGMDAGGRRDALFVDGHPVGAARGGGEVIGAPPVGGDALDQLVVVAWCVVAAVAIEADPHVGTGNESGGAVVAVHVFVDRSADTVRDGEAGDGSPCAALSGRVDGGHAPVERAEWPAQQ